MTLSSNPSARPRRFYKAVDVGPRDGGFAVLLDGRVPKTPGGNPLIAPTEALARLLAAEWDAQAELIVLDRMHATRLANTVLDRVSQVHGETAVEVSRYAGSDVVCYFADFPANLAARQAEQWGAVLDWARDELGLRFERASGILHRPQPDETLEKIRVLAEAENDFTLAGLVFAASLYSSAVLALAVRRGRLTGEAAFDLSRLDEVFQEERWGVDEAAAMRTEGLRLEARMVGEWLAALR